MRPAVDVGISVSRVGGNAQVGAMKKVAAKLRLDLAAYQELKNFARLGTELDSAAQTQLDRGNRMVELLKQPQGVPLSVGRQVITIFAGSSGLLDDVPIASVSRFAVEMLKWLAEKHPEYIKEIDTTKEFSDKLAEKLKSAISAFKQSRDKGIG
jgi:F-type H+/Na+-transporting ATPase subunit alpha